MDKLSFSVAQMDAPLDLILQLISKHKLDITDIDISSLLEQYMGIIREWQEQNLDVASEFLEMASRLVYIKTVSLLPRHKEEHDRLRRELSGRLIEYRLCKLAAGSMRELFVGQDIFVRPPAALERDLAYTPIHKPTVLFAALCDAMGRGARRLPPPREAFDPLVSRPVVSITAKIFSVLRTLRLEGCVTLDRLYAKSGGRSGIVATFLAVLELVKSKKVTLSSDTVAPAFKAPRTPS